MATNPGQLQPRQAEVIDHGASKVGLWLRHRRVQIALWIAVIEGLLVAVHFINRWVAISVAIAAVTVYFFVGRESKSLTLRQVSWIAATSQALVVLVPFALILFGTFALIAVGLLAIVALVALFSDRP
jgi:hypothetical protein